MKSKLIDMSDLHIQDQRLGQTIFNALRLDTKGKTISVQMTGALVADRLFSIEDDDLVEWIDRLREYLDTANAKGEVEGE